MRMFLLAGPLVACGLVMATPVGEVPGPADGGVVGVDDSGGLVHSAYDYLWDALEEDCLRSRPLEFLVDTGNHLGVGERSDRLRFLEYHSTDSEVDLYAFVFGAEERLPMAAEVEKFLDLHFGGEEPVVLVMYPHGNPSRAELFLNPRLDEVISAQEARRALESAVQKAQEETDAASQFEAFLLQVSMRLYWMEHALGLGAVVEEPESAEPVAVGPPAVSREPGLWEKMDPVLRNVEPWAGKLGIVSAVSLAGCLLLVVARIRAKNEFPDFAVEPRLGGAHGAGVGAVISFSHAAKSPASQRDPGKDLLGRL